MSDLALLLRWGRLPAAMTGCKGWFLLDSWHAVPFLLRCDVCSQPPHLSSPFLVAVCAAVCAEIQGSASQERVAAALAAAGAVSVNKVAALARAGEGVWSLVARDSAPPERWQALMHTCRLLLAARQAKSPSPPPPST